MSQWKRESIINLVTSVVQSTSPVDKLTSYTSIRYADSHGPNTAIQSSGCQVGSAVQLFLRLYVDVTTMMVILYGSLYCNMGIDNHPYIHELHKCTVFGTYLYVALSQLRPQKIFSPLGIILVSNNTSHRIFGNTFPKMYP